MAATQLVKIVVQELTKYGFKADGRYINYSKKLSEEDKALVVPGASLDAEFYVADSGKEYLNKILGSVTKYAPKSEVKMAPKSEAKQTPKETVSNGLSKDEWAAKDTRISRQGCIQAAVQAVGGDFDEAVVLADKMLKFVNQEVK